MNLPQVNPDGYVTASISNVTAFHNFNYLLAHGSGDDNVHYANSAHLLDMFTQEKVRSFRFRMFTDRWVSWLSISTVCISGWRLTCEFVAVIIRYTNVGRIGKSTSS